MEVAYSPFYCIYILAEIGVRWRVKFTDQFYSAEFLLEKVYSAVKRFKTTGCHGRAKKAN